MPHDKHANSKMDPYRSDCCAPTVAPLQLDRNKVSIEAVPTVTKGESQEEQGAVTVVVKNQADHGMLATVILTRDQL